MNVTNVPQNASVTCALEETDRGGLLGGGLRIGAVIHGHSCKHHWSHHVANHVWVSPK